MEKPSPIKLSLLKHLASIEAQLESGAETTTFIVEYLEMIHEYHMAKLEHVLAMLEDAQAERNRSWSSRIKVWLKAHQKEKGK